MPDIGSPAPTFTLFDHTKEAVSLESLRGKNVVLAFIPAAFTGTCEKELCTFRDALSNFNDMNAEVLAISVDAPFSNKAFAERNQLTFKILSDYKRETIAAYGVEIPNFAGMDGYTAAQRSVFVVDAEGKLTWQWVADNPGQEPDYDAVKAAVAALN